MTYTREQLDERRALVREVFALQSTLDNEAIIEKLAPDPVPSVEVRLHDDPLSTWRVTYDNVTREYVFHTATQKRECRHVSIVSLTAHHNRITWDDDTLARLFALRDGPQQLVLTDAQCDAVACVNGRIGSDKMRNAIRAAINAAAPAPREIVGYARKTDDGKILDHQLVLGGEWTLERCRRNIQGFIHAYGGRVVPLVVGE